MGENRCDKAIKRASDISRLWGEGAANLQSAPDDVKPRYTTALTSGGSRKKILGGLPPHHLGGNNS